MKKKFYVTTPIYYVNDVPHIGHAYTTIAADIVARYHRLIGDNVFFQTGTDEHGAKVAEAAKEHGKSPKEYCDDISPRFVQAWKLLNISYDHYLRTTNPQHEKIAQEIVAKIYKKGDIYKGQYKGLYCVGCEKFLTQDDLIDGKCPLHPTMKLVYSEEENYFFKLSKYRDILLRAVQNPSDPLHYKISPEIRLNEILSKLKMGIDDLSISRAKVEWGIPIPWDKTQTIYVWVEALLNYHSGLEIAGKQEFWPPDLQLMAKDIFWFHAVIWPALLIAADLKLPKEIFAHGFFTVDGQKMSKSVGNVISPKQLVEKFEADGARYLLFSEFPFGQDGDISLTRFTTRYNADLANGLGNLVQRVAKLCERVKFERPLKPVNLWKKETQLNKHLDKYQFNEALAYIWESIRRLDKEIDKSRPWEKNGKELEKILTELVGNLLEIASSLKPFMPKTAEKIEKIFTANKIKAGKPLFPRI